MDNIRNHRAIAVWRNPHLWYITAIMIACSIFYYLHAIIELMGWTNPQWGIFYAAHDLHTLLFFIPVLYAAHIFRVRGAIVTALISILIFLPRAFLPRAIFILPYPEALLRPIAFLIVIGVVGLLLARLLDDITKRKRAEQALRETRDYLGSLLQYANGPIIVWDTEQRITIFNTAFERMTGHMAGEVMVQSLSILFPEASRDESMAKIRQTSSGEYWESVEIPILCKDGEIRIVLWNSANIYDKDGKTLLATIAQGQDITERKRMEQDLGERVKELQCLYGIARVAERADITLDELYQEAVNLLPQGWQYPEITSARITINDKKFETENCRDTEWKQSSDIKVYGAKVGEVEVSYLEERPEIDEGPFLKEERLLLDAVAKQLGRITERMRAEEALKESEEKLRTFMETASDLMHIADKDGNITYVNESTARTLRYSKEEMIGKHITQFLSKEIVEKAFKLKWEELITKGKIDIEATWVARDGKEIYGEQKVVAIYDSDGNYAGSRAVFRDITERKRMEQRIEHLNAVLQAIRNVNQLIARERDRDKLLKGACDSLIETPGYFNAWLAILDESEGLVTTAESGLGKKFLSIVEQLKRGELTHCVREALRQSEVVVTEDPFSTCVDCPLAGRYRGMGALTVRLEYGGRVYGVMSVSIPKALIADEEEQSLFKEVASDIAFALCNIELEERRKQAEQELQEKTRELKAASQLKSEFLAGMSHELRTPLNAVIGFSELILDGVPGEINDEQRQCLNDILSSGQHVLNLVNDVLDLSKVEVGKMELKPENLNLADVIDDVAQTVRLLLDDNRHKLGVSVEEGLPPVRADKNRLRQIFLNLLSNAIKFTPAGGQLGIEAVREGDWCQVSMIDNGIGISKEDQERIFEPFCQLDNPLTKEKSGTGLGLTLVNQIIEKHGGRIWVESEYGKGSRFTFILPLATTA